MRNFDLRHQARFEKTVALDPTGSFRLNDVNGSVTVESWDQAKVEIEAEKAASSESYLERIEIDVTGQGDHVYVTTHMPRGGFLFGGHGKVDYHIRLPGQARANVGTVNGAVRVEGLGGEVRASTVNGSVRISDVAGVVDASTVNGSIRAGYRKLAEGRHAFNTTNGSVTLYLPPDASGDFEARTVNGSITSEFPLTISGKIGSHHLQGRLGDGRGSFHIRTVNGSVKLLKTPEPDKVVRNLLESSHPLQVLLCGATPRNMTGGRWSWSTLPALCARPSGWRGSSRQRASTIPYRSSNTAAV